MKLKYNVHDDKSQVDTAGFTFHGENGQWLSLYYTADLPMELILFDRQTWNST